MSQRVSGHDRKQNDAYFTPAWVVDCLLADHDVKGASWEPACGDGQIVKALRKSGLKAGGADIHYYGFLPGGVDFLEQDCIPAGYENIITNPPYGRRGKLAEQFIEHAVNLVPPGGLVAMLLASDFDYANGRRHLFKDNQNYLGSVKLLKRIKWTNLEHTASPSQNHCWFIWVKGMPVSMQGTLNAYAHPDDLLKEVA